MVQNDENSVDFASKANRTDALALVAKSALGAVPVLGPMMAEIVGAIIPNQRFDRLTRLVEVLAEKVKDVERALVGARLKTSQGVDLLEDGFLQAARALSEERIGYIADILRAGITDEQSKMAEKKHLMRILGELDDEEVILLARYGGLVMGTRGEEFAQRHALTIGPKSISSRSSQMERDEAALYEGRKTHLVNLGLLRLRFQKPRRGQAVSADALERMTKPAGHAITPLGRLLLRTINPQ